jgi:hypothetical protein
LKAPNHREGSIALHMESEREHMLGVTETWKEKEKEKTNKKRE